MRLDKYLADMTGLTRSVLKKMIRKGLAEAEGSIVRDPAFAVTETSCVKLKGQTVVYRKYVWYMMNKPAGLVTATEDRREKCVLDLLSEQSFKGLFPVGRLDKDTEGLLLITNDGAASHRLLSPKYHVDKTYYARIRGRVTKEDAAAFAEGLRVDAEFTALPAGLTIIRSGEESEVRVTIREGKFHQIKRMFEAVGKEVVYLKRLSMGNLTLDESLSPGNYRELTAPEVSLLTGETGEE